MMTRPINVLNIASYAKTPPTPAEQAALNLTAAARGLPDDDFQSDPAVIRAAAAADAWSTRLERLAAYPNKQTAIASLIAGIEAELGAARQTYRFSCIDSFLAGDHELSAAVAAQEHVSLLESRLQAAKDAKRDIDRCPGNMSDLYQLSDNATANYQSKLFEAKKQAVLARQQVATADTD